jgi:hypothetical protein
VFVRGQCANPGAADTGCDNAQGTGGVRASVVLFDPDVPAAVVRCTGFPVASTPTAVLLRSTALAAPHLFGDGLLCVGAPVVRMSATTALSGVSVHGIGHGAPPGTYEYQAWYRSSPAGFCTPDGFNVSSGVTIRWP